MKTETKIIKTLFGAVPTLLVTFGLTQNAAALARLLIIGLATLAAAPSEAAQNGGGEAAAGALPGEPSTTSAPGRMRPTGARPWMTTMNSDGSGKTQLGLGMFGIPSTVPHNNHRWFVYTYVIPDQYYPDGITRRSEVFALRDDFDRNLNNKENTMVQLTDDITLQPRVNSADWVPGDQQVSFIGRRWSSAEPGATVAEGGIYTASLVFGADGNIIGLAAQPATPAISVPLVESAPGGLWPDVLVYSWAPTADMVAYSNDADNELWVADLLGAHIRITMEVLTCLSGLRLATRSRLPSAAPIAAYIRSSPTGRAPNESFRVRPLGFSTTPSGRPTGATWSLSANPGWRTTWTFFVPARAAIT